MTKKQIYKTRGSDPRVIFTPFTGPPQGSYLHGRRHKNAIQARHGSSYYIISPGFKPWRFLLCLYKALSASMRRFYALLVCLTSATENAIQRILGLYSIYLHFVTFL